MATQSKKQRKAVLKRKLQSNRAVQGLMRKDHFENGGDLASWRGTANVFTDRRKKADKRSCRNFRWEG